jgi:hypothetical protein
MSLNALLAELVTALTSARIPFMLTGSLAAAIHGAGRATMDVDLVIDATELSLGVFVESVRASGHYVSDDAARDALARRTMFNVIDTETGWKVDLIMLKDRAFSQAEFKRRIEAKLGMTSLQVATVEDLVIAKLEWAKLGASVRQLDDVRELLRIGGSSIDRDYVEGWIDQLHLKREWAAVQ